MGCNTCNQENQKTQQNGDATDFSAVSDQLMHSPVNKHFFLKVATFISIVIALPFIIVALIFQVFGTFFLPKSIEGLNTKFRNGFQNIFKWLVKIRAKKELRKREQAFVNNGNYEEGSELIDIEVYEDLEDNKQEELI